MLHLMEESSKLRAVAPQTVNTLLSRLIITMIVD